MLTLSGLARLLSLFRLTECGSQNRQQIHSCKTLATIIQMKELLNKLIKTFRMKKEDNSLTNTAWHEAGHAVFANIFKDYIVINKISILPSEYGKGHNHLITKRFENVLDNFHLIVINLAGLAVQHMTDKRDNQTAFQGLVVYLDKRLKDNGQINDSFDGDFKGLQEPLEILSHHLKKEKNKVLILALVYIANCLMKCNEFWPAIDILVEKLLEKKELTKQEIEEIFNETGFNEFLIKFRQNFINETYRLLTED